MDKKYNGFNNCRDKSDGVGGREVNHGTQETMTNEQIGTKLNSIKLCLQAHPDNQPDSEFEDRISDIEDIEQQLSAERERAGKLVSGLNELKEDMELDGYVNYSNEIDILITNYEQTLNEYDTATKES